MLNGITSVTSHGKDLAVPEVIRNHGAAILDPISESYKAKGTVIGDLDHQVGCLFH